MNKCKTHGHVYELNEVYEYEKRDERNIGTEREYTSYRVHEYKCLYCNETYEQYEVIA